MAARMRRQQPRRPQLVWIPEILRLAAREVNQPSPRLDRDLRRAPRAWSVVKRRQDAKRLRALDTALHRLVMHAQRATDREERRVLPVGKQHSGALDATRRLASRPRYRPQLRQFLPTNRHIDHSPRRCHGMLRRQHAPSHPYHILRLAGNSPQPIEIKESLY
jgi:hypothetical protein